jgi:hypothetical protein
MTLCGEVACAEKSADPAVGVASAPPPPLLSELPPWVSVDELNKLHAIMNSSTEESKITLFFCIIHLSPSITVEDKYAFAFQNCQIVDLPCEEVKEYNICDHSYKRASLNKPRAIFSKHSTWVTVT